MNAGTRAHIGMHSSAEWFSQSGALLLCLDHIGGTEIQTVQTAGPIELWCLSKKQISTNHQVKSPETK